MRKRSARAVVVRRLLGVGFAACLAAGSVMTSAPALAAQCPAVSANGTVTPAPQPGVNWSRCDLSGANLRYVDMWKADLSHANLTGASMNAGNFTFVNFTAANLSRADAAANLSNANLTDANFSGADAMAQFGGANLQGTRLGDADLTGAESGSVNGVPASLPANWHLLTGYLLGPGADLAEARLAGLNLTGYDLSGANLYGATLTGTALAGATLRGVMSGHITTVPKSLPAHWVVDFGFLLGPGTNLYGTNLSGDNLSGLDLAGSFLMAANLTKADLAGADLQGSDLSKATLRGADLSGDDLSTSNLQGTSSGGVVGIPALPPHWRLANGYLIGPWADLTGASLAGQDLSGADLFSAFLESADLSNANLDTANLQFANLYLASVAGATFTGASWYDTACPDGSVSNKYVDGCFSALDITPPTAHPATTGGSPGAHGWYTSPVTVSWHWSDDGTIDQSACDSQTTTTGSGSHITLTATCHDLAGNTGTASYSVKVDLTRPAVSVTGVRNGHTYRRGHVPVAGCRTTELVSGVAVRARVKVTTSGKNGLGRFTATCAGAVSVAGTRQARPVQVRYTVIR